MIKQDAALLVQTGAIQLRNGGVKRIKVNLIHLSELMITSGHRTKSGQIGTLETVEIEN